jgi:hypothetical protein
VFHVELRQFPNTTRAFNLTEEELHRRFTTPWVEGRLIEADERRWSPEKAKLTIYEGPALRVDEIGMGRGWGNVTRAGQDVTAKVLHDAQRTLAPSGSGESVSELKLDVVQRAARGALRFGEVVSLADQRHPGRRASERLALAEQTVWELLHEGRVEMTRGGVAVGQQDWEAVVLAWQSWAPDQSSPDVYLALAG